jgi:hypothetical protein
MAGKIKIAVKTIKLIPLEAWMWIAGLIYLAFINPYEQQYFTFCPFHNLGIEFCPGCGLGRSISFFYHGDIINSLKTHPLGIAAFIVISHRIFSLIRINFQFKTGEVYHA